MAAKAPCQNCMDRVLGCHDVCPKYKNFKNERAKETTIIRNIKNLEAAQLSYVIQQREKYRRSGR